VDCGFSLVLTSTLLENEGKIAGASRGSIKVIDAKFSSKNRNEEKAKKEGKSPQEVS